MRKNLENNINFWKILAIYNAYDPLKRLPNISVVDEYVKEAEIFLEIMNSKKTLKKNINKIHEEIFNSQINEGLLLLLRDEMTSIFPKRFQDDENISKKNVENRILEHSKKIKLNTQKKIGYLRSTGNFDSFQLNDKRIFLQKNSINLMKNFIKNIIRKISYLIYK